MRGSTQADWTTELQEVMREKLRVTVVGKAESEFQPILGATPEAGPETAPW